MKKILAIDQGEHLGGAEIFLSEVLRGLAGDARRAHEEGANGNTQAHASDGSAGRRATYEVHLLTSGGDKYLSLYENSRVKLHRADLPRLSPFSPRALLRFRRAAAALGKKMAQISPDLVISNTVRTHILCSAAASRLQIPLLWFAHDLTFPKVLLRRFIRFPKTIVCCSEFVRAYYASALPRNTFFPRNASALPRRVSTSKVEVVHPFAISKEEIAALAAIAPNKHDPAEPRVVGMVGNFIPWKGQDLFIKAAIAVLARRSGIHARHPNVRFQIIGRTYEGNPASARYRKECEKLAAPLLAAPLIAAPLTAGNAPLIVANVLTIRESVPSAIEEMAKWQILVHCSKEPEPLGRVILEGMAAGCAVIASNLGGPREIVRSVDYKQETKPDGLLVSPDAKALTAAVLSLLDDPAMSQTLAENAREKIIRDYSQEKMHAKIADIILKTL